MAPDVGYRAVDTREIVSAALCGIERYALSDAVREDYLSAYEGDRFVESVRHVRLPNGASDPCRALPQIETPAEVIDGVWDWAVPPSTRYLHERLPRSNLDLVDAGNFTWKNAADRYAGTATGQRTGGHARA